MNFRACRLCADPPWCFWLGKVDFHGFLLKPELFPCFLLGAGRPSEVPLCSGGSNGEAGRIGEENWQSRGGLEALLGGAEGGEAGKGAPQTGCPAPACCPKPSDLRDSRRRVEARVPWEAERP